MLLRLLLLSPPPSSSSRANECVYGDRRRARPGEDGEDTGWAEGTEETGGEREAEVQVTEH